MITLECKNCWVATATPCNAVVEDRSLPIKVIQILLMRKHLDIYYYGIRMPYRGIFGERFIHTHLGSAQFLTF